MAPKSPKSSGPQRMISEVMREKFSNREDAEALVGVLVEKAIGGNSADLKLLVSLLTGDPKDFNNEGEDEILVQINKMVVKTTIETCPHCGEDVTLSPDNIAEAKAKKEKLKEPEAKETADEGA